MNLQELKILCSDPKQKDNSIHYLIKNDISAGRANILTSLVELRSLNIVGPTLTDLCNLVYFIYETGDAPSVATVTSLEISILAETLPHTGYTVYHSEAFVPISDGTGPQAHSTGGKPISDLLDLFPKLEMLSLFYNREDEWDFLIVQDLRKAILPRLWKLWMHGFACK